MKSPVASRVDDAQRSLACVLLKDEVGGLSPGIARNNIIMAIIFLQDALRLNHDPRNTVNPRPPALEVATPAASGGSIKLTEV